MPAKKKRDNLVCSRYLSSFFHTNQCAREHIVPPSSRHRRYIYNIYIHVGRGWDCCVFAHDFSASVGLQSFLLKHRRTRGSSARADPASDTIRGQRRQIPPRSNESSDDPPAAVKGKGRMRDQKNCAHPSHFDIYRSLLRPYLSYVGRGWDCCVFAHDFLRQIPTPPTWQRLGSHPTLHWDYSCLGHISWSEVVLLNTFAQYEYEHCAGATLPRTYTMGRGSITTTFHWVAPTV